MPREGLGNFGAEEEARDGGQEGLVTEMDVEESSPSSSPMSSPAGSSDSIDLNFLPFLKREPKSEPSSPELGPLPLPVSLTQTPPQQHAAAAAPATEASVPPPPATPDLSSASMMTPLQSLPPNPDEDSLLREYYRLARLYLSSAGSGAIVPTPAPEAAAPAVVQSGAGSVVKKRRPRSSELVRVSSLGVQDQIYFRDLVRRARITFECLRGLLLRDDERAESLGLAGAAGFGVARDRRRARADMRAAALMADHDLWLNRDRRIVGPMPGISVGDAFFFRMELCVLGLHGQVQAGIDYVSAGRSASGEPIATSIIVSGGYEDDDDHGDVLVYTGHGGRDPNLHKHCVDQKLEGGNLALERSMAYGIEIRVIRAVKSRRSPIGKVYFYDGLYKVVDYWLDRGKSGFGVYKYKMLRIEGQEPMGTVNYRAAEQLKVDVFAVRPTGYFSFDISMGRETLPVALYNDVDDDQDPLLFEYLTRPIFPTSAVQGKFAEGGGGGGCDCAEICSIGCNCAGRNGGEFAYNKTGTLLRGKPLVYECGPYCRCPPSCPNRVSQKGLQHRLEVFRSRETGWGVRSLDLIKAGTFICEFSGIVLTHQQSEVMAANGDCLVRPNRFPPRWLDWGDISDVYPDYVAPDHPVIPELNFAIDVSRARNVACYFSHSCSPNVFIQFVLFDHYNVSYPHLMIFAMENIPPLRELSIDYGMVDEWTGQLTM
ncbi:histone-lysine N-methyltransferase family member SUVH2 [Zea mays]|uniref:Histone-lysine N-methyltransferase family member SUVH9 n=1 Tax=Zea mays TaxID=4577 RepID=A0A804MM69_MAIZE|nr:histone-lysine N-methyltransferase family member SUVH2 [Zea mays]XP_008670074.1 histone-lysine N-methyltransferase family member SUVH2 [Zea mays]XP_008670075.1 histone-lysine N-methyltransferase family member SUVH2 [Zea mays]XP_023157431.1 histone-lysine N-methyltransferase family member SUVH2 [Zea mays]|eukprot:XP_008670073.1 histone-lysine N-methyltransferase family member SUVH2 [Zea mays]